MPADMASAPLAPADWPYPLPASPRRRRRGWRSTTPPEDYSRLAPRRRRSRPPQSHHRGPPATTADQPLRHPSPLLGAPGAALAARRHRTSTVHRRLRRALPNAVFSPPAPARRLDPDTLPPMRRACQDQCPHPQPPPTPRRRLRALPRRHHHRALLRRPRHPQQHPTRQLSERALRHDRVEAQLRPTPPALPTNPDQPTPRPRICLRFLTRDTAALPDLRGAPSNGRLLNPWTRSWFRFSTRDIRHGSATRSQ